MDSDRIESAEHRKSAVRTTKTWLLTFGPGVAVSLLAAAASYMIGALAKGTNPLLIAIILGILATNLVHMPGSLTPGINFAAKKLLRAGIVLLGLRLVLADILGLGIPMLLVVVGIVVGGMFGTIALGRALKVPKELTLLVACGFSICGAAAVAGAAGVTDPEGENEEATITAVALVVIFGTLMIPLVPLIAAALGLAPRTAGLWAGGSIHEIAQVVAVGSIIGGGALAVAVIVKLARVLMLAPVIAALSIRQRRMTGTDTSAGNTARPPLVPMFIIGFLAMVLVRSFIPLPEAVLDVGSVAQTVLLAAAMFGLGCGVKVRNLMKVGARPFALATASTLLVSLIAYGGVALVTHL